LTPITPPAGSLFHAETHATAPKRCAASSDAVAQGAGSVAAAACAAAVTAVVTGRIPTRTPRGRSSQYGSVGRARVSMEKPSSRDYLWHDV
jgi:hypothetical protein